MAALAYLTALRAEEAENGAADGGNTTPYLLSVPEIRRLIGHVIVTPHCSSHEHGLHWSRYRRTSRARARRCHYQHQGQTPQMRLQY